MSQPESSAPVLRAVVRDVRTLGMMLRAIAFTPLCQVTASGYGLQVITEVNGVLQATAYLSSGLFAEYEYNAPQEDMELVDDSELDAPSSIFETSLSDLLVCLNIYGNAGISVPGKAKESEEESARRRERERQALLKGVHLDTELRLLYEGRGSPLILQLHEGNTATRCELATFEANTALITDMPFLSDRVVGQVIMASKDLTEVLQSIDTSSKHVSISFQVASQQSSARLPSKGEKGQSGEDTITSLADPVSVSDSTHAGSASMILATAESDDDEEVAPPRISQAAASVPMMMIQSEGDSGSTQLELPNQHDVFEQFSYTHNSTNAYQFPDLQRCLKALQTSLKTSLRVDDEGMMSLQCLFPRKAETAADPYLDANRAQQTDPERQGFVELKILPIVDEERE